jgi:hypothetical protein
MKTLIYSYPDDSEADLIFRIFEAKETTTKKPAISDRTRQSLLFCFRLFFYGGGRTLEHLF